MIKGTAEYEAHVSTGFANITPTLNSSWVLLTESRSQTMGIREILESCLFPRVFFVINWLRNGASPLPQPISLRFFTLYHKPDQNGIILSQGWMGFFEERGAGDGNWKLFIMIEYFVEWKITFLHFQLYLILVVNNTIRSKNWNKIIKIRLLMDFLCALTWQVLN